MPRLRADLEEFFKYFRMDEAAFDKLLEKIRPRITKRSNRGVIGEEERLMITLCFLAICALHNYVIDETVTDGPATLADSGIGNDDNGRRRRQAPPLMPLPARGRNGRPTQAALDMRQRLLEFFNGVGAVEWQNDYA